MIEDILRSDFIMPALINLLNQTFGNLEVIEKLPSRNGKVYWKCKCKICGKEYEIQTCHLKDGTYRKCCEESTIDFIPETKTCAICGKTFTTIRYGHSRRFCFDCSPQYNHGESRSANITSIRRAIKKKLVEYKGGKCERCGYNKCIWALQFHHKDPNEKDFSISSQLNLSNFNMDNYYKEVDKCELLCANCHAEEHATEYV